MSLRIAELAADPSARFPPVEDALREPDGLLAFGGDLSPARLLDAYRNGIFPWYSDGDPILWWSPSQRAVLRTDAVRLPRRLQRDLRHCGWQVRADTCFAQVVGACATAPRQGQSGTWITAAMQQAYLRLHQLGHAHSIEVWNGDALVGGLYGVAVGRMFCGESMFSAASGASSVALAMLARTLHGWGWPLIDAQVANAHTQRLGAESWPRAAYLEVLQGLRDADGVVGGWTTRFGEPRATVLGDRPPA
jgi:leucyl/phenylalanyl-tRNA--protein transferase